MGIRSLLIALALTGVESATCSRAETLDVYFGTGVPKGDGIYHSTFDTLSGKLSPATMVAKVVFPGFLAIHPDHRALYAVAKLPEGYGVIGYHIGPGGSLDPFTKILNPGARAVHLAVHPSGRFLVTAQYDDGSVTFIPLDGEGKLGNPILHRHEGGSGVVKGRQDSPHPHSCSISPDGNYVLIPDLGLDGVAAYRVNAGRTDMERSGFYPSVKGGGARHMKFSPDGSLIYLLNELSLSLSTFSWDATKGTATLLASVPTLPESLKAGEIFHSAAEILVHPGGKFLYSSNRGNDSVSVFRANPSSGQHDLIQVQPIRGAFPRNINITPAGDWLLAAGEHSDTISVHRIDQATGKLTFQTDGIINLPSPICIVFSPSPLNGGGTKRD
jgi:6-phosphogluconolactonase